MSELRHQWQISEIIPFFEMPLLELVYQAQTVHRQFFPANQVQLSTLLSIKTGACPEDCAYCPQSGHHNAKLEKESVLPLDAVIAKAKIAKANGASRFCMGAAWRNPPKKDFPKVLAMIKGVKALGLETCVTLGMLDDAQAQQLKEAGLDYYNHNLDTSPEYYKEIITTRTYEDRLQTLERVRDNQINVCCGGIVGLGETREDRIAFLQQLVNLPEHPQSVPINRLVVVAGTPLENTKPMDDFEFVRTIAVARILMPKSYVRLSAGRESMNEMMQALCFMAGANSIFYGEKLLTTANPIADFDKALFAKLGITAHMPHALLEDACT